MGNENKKTVKSKFTPKDKANETSTNSVNKRDSRTKRQPNKENAQASMKIVSSKGFENLSTSNEENESFEDIFRHNKIEEMIKWGPRSELLGLTPLAVLTVIGDEDCLKKFIEAGADLNEKCQTDGNTALMVAIQGKKLATTEILLKHGAVVSEVNSYGNNALMLAIRTGDSKLVNIVWTYRKKLNINHQNMTGCTALHFAADKAWETCTQFLLSHGANPNIAHVGGWTPLIFAAMKGDRKVIEILTKGGARILREDSIGSTALCYSILEEKENCLEYLMEQLSSKQKEAYVKSRIDKLRTPKDEDAESYYHETLFPVLLYLCKVDEAVKGFLYGYKLLPTIIQVARRYIKNRMLMITASQIICSALYFEKMCVDERFVDQFLRSKGPELVLDILRQWPLNEKVSSHDSDSDCVWVSFMSIVIIVDSEAGRLWLTDNCARVRDFATVFRDNFIFENAPEHWLKDLFERLWVQFQSFFEGIATTQCEKNLAELLAEEERENKKRERKRFKRKLKKQRQQQLKETLQSDNSQGSSVQQTSENEGLEHVVEGSIKFDGDTAQKFKKRLYVEQNPNEQINEKNTPESSPNKSYMQMDTNNNTKGSAARRRRKKTKNRPLSRTIEHWEDDRQKENTAKIIASCSETKGDCISTSKENTDKVLWTRVQPKRVGVKKAKQDGAVMAHQQSTAFNRVDNVGKNLETAIVTPVVATPPPLKMMWSDVARGDSKVTSKRSIDSLENQNTRETVDPNETTSTHREVSVNQHQLCPPFITSDEFSTIPCQQSDINTLSTTIIPSQRVVPILPTTSTNIPEYERMLQFQTQQQLEFKQTEVQWLNDENNLRFPGFHSQGAICFEQGTNEQAAECRINTQCPSDATIDLATQNQPLTLHSIAKSFMSNNEASVGSCNMDNTKWNEQERNSFVYHQPVDMQSTVSMERVDTRRSNASLNKMQESEESSGVYKLSNSMQSTLPEDHLIQENVYYVRLDDDNYCSSQSSNDNTATSNKHSLKENNCPPLRHPDLHLNLPDDEQDDANSLDGYEIECSRLPHDFQNTSFQPFNYGHCKDRNLGISRETGQAEMEKVSQTRSTAFKPDISTATRSSYHFPSFHSIVPTIEPEKPPLPYLDRLEVLIAQQIKNTAQKIQTNKVMADTAYFHDLDYYASTLRTDLNTIMETDLNKLLLANPNEQKREMTKGDQHSLESPKPVMLEKGNNEQNTDGRNNLLKYCKDDSNVGLPKPTDVMYKRTWVPKSRRWRTKMMEIFHLPPNMRFQIGEIVVPFEAYKYNINQSGTPVVLGFMVDGSEVAVKILDIPDTPKNVEQMRQLTSDVSKHYFLASYKAFAFFDSRCYLAADLYEYTLEEYIQVLNMEHKMNLLSADKLVWQLIKGVAVLHESLKIVHGNLKPASILIDIDGKLKLGNFGVLESDKGTPRSVFTTADDRCWKSTESLTGQDGGKPTCSSDVQVMGMLMHYILTGGKHPFGESPFEIEVNICHGFMKMSFLSEEAADLLGHFLQPRPELRSTIIGALKHPYFWAEEKKFRFMLISGSDVLRDMKAGGAPSSPRIGPSMIDILNTPSTPEFVGNWMNFVDEVILKEMRQFRTYKNTLSEVVLFIYNCCLHFDKMSGECREVLDDPCKYFLRILPSLFIAVYNSIKGSDRKERTCYKPFF